MNTTPEPEPWPLGDVESIAELTDQLNKQAEESRLVLAISSTEGDQPGDGINKITYATEMRASRLKPMRVEPVPEDATAEAADKATTPDDKQAVKVRFAAFVAPKLEAAEALCRAEVFIKKTKTEIVLLRGAEPFDPRGRERDEPVAPATPVPSVAGASRAFLDFMPFIFEWEGETFENDPDDPGGATKFGIDQRSHPNVDIHALTKEQATAIYWEEWNEDGCAPMASPYAEVYFNCAVNMGLGRARQFHKLTHGDARDFLTTQEGYYRSLADRKATFKKYLKGWLNRTTALRKRFGL